MDICNLQQHLKFVNQIGQTLSIEERMRIELALLKLSEQYKFDYLQFWGRLEAIDRDYYIVLGLQCKGEYEFPKKRFFWSSGNNFQFSELPPFNNEYASRAEQLRTPFTGQHENIVFKADNNNQVQNLDDSLEIPSQIPPKSFTEVERLSFVVNTIEHECALIPVGAYKLTPTHELLVNDGFNGLNNTDVNNYASYMHFRQPLTEEKREFIARDDALFKLNFLDSVTDDYPSQQWSLQSDSTKSNVTIRNLIWPGFIAYHKSNSNVFGYAYFGDGVRNSDFEFII